MPTKKDIDEYSIIKLYRAGIGVMELSTMYNVHRSTIQRLLIRNNIKFHSRIPKNTYDYTFFSSYTHDSCYWAGFIMADGHIRENIKKKQYNLHIKLKLSDIDHLEKFKKCIKYNGNIHKSKSYCYIDISGSIMVNDLFHNFNIINKKSLTAKFPTQIPYEYLSHFIRGYFDGDGTVYLYKSKNIHSGFIGTYDMLTNIQQFAFNNFIRARTKDGLNKLYHRSDKNTYSLTYGKVNTNKLLRLIYKDSSNLNRLDRKYEFFKMLDNS